MSINREDALRIAAEFVARAVEPGVGQPVVLTSIREFPQCWVVGFNTRAYWETRSIRHALAGGGPLIIDKASGEQTVALSALPLEDQVDGDEISRTAVEPPAILDDASHTGRPLAEDE